MNANFRGDFPGLHTEADEARATFLWTGCVGLIGGVVAFVIGCLICTPWKHGLSWDYHARSN